MEYDNISILYAAGRCGIDVDYNRHKEEIEVNCPFCNDRKKHLSLNTAKNQFRCNRCKKSGNSITLYAKFHNIDNVTAYRELTEGGVFKEPVYKQETLPQVTQYEIKPLSARHDVYYDMLQMLDLSASHKLQLLNRGLDREAIEHNMYRTAPESDSKLYRSMMRSLSKEHDLAGIPGFYLISGKWRMVTKEGLFVPVCNQQGYIQGLQVRLDDAASRKYRWLSSNHYDGGTKVYPWIHVANWNSSKTVYITEGALKAEVASFLMGNVCVIGIAGVNCISGLTGLLKELAVTEVIEAIDMDKFTNTYVSDALKSLKASITVTGVKYRSAKWNPAYKGIDDFCLALRGMKATAAAA